MIRIFRHYISGVYLGLSGLEFVVYFCSIFAGIALRSGQFVFFNHHFILATFFALTMLICSTSMGAYQRVQVWERSGLNLRLILAFGLGGIVMSLFFFLLPEYTLGRGAFALAMVFAFIAIVSFRWVFYRLVGRQFLRRRILVLGAGRQAMRVLAFEQSRGQQEIDVLGCIRIGHESVLVPDNKIINLDVPLHEYAELSDLDDIVVALDDRRGGLPVDEILDCKMSGFQVLDLVTFFEREAGLIHIESLHPSWFVFSDGFHIATGLFAKRIFDIAASLCLLCISWPVMLVVALAIWLEGEGPVLYRQVRVGVNWSLITIYKFRSMYVNAENGRPQMTSEKDKRITRVGRFIRKFRLDELPQLYNVLKGEMSFVGPRPERPEFVEKYIESIPYYSERLRVKPGITGWAQLCFRYANTDQDARDKLQYDLYYIKNYSLFLDLMILLQTIEIVLWGKGAR